MIENYITFTGIYNKHNLIIDIQTYLRKGNMLKGKQPRLLDKVLNRN